MAIIRSIPSTKFINDVMVNTSEISLVSEQQYITNGESCIVVRGVIKSKILLDSKTTDHVTIKSMTTLTIVPDIGLIDEEFEEIVLEKFACIEFRFINNNWYILSSDGLKQN